VPAVAEDPSLAETERTRGRAFATALSMRVLSRTWQMLFKGLQEVQSAGKPMAAAEMVLVRIAYAADLPTPDEAVRELQQNGGSGASPAPNGNGGSSTRPALSPRMDAPRGAPRASLGPAQLVTAQVPDYSAVRAQQQPAPARAQPAVSVQPAAGAQPAPGAIVLNSFPELVTLAHQKRDILTGRALERDVRLVRFEDGKLEIALEPAASRTLVHELQRKISEWTGRRWMVVVSTEAGAPTIQAQNEVKQGALEQGVRADPLVQKVLARFPGAEIVGVRRRDDPVTSSAPETPSMDDMPLPNPDDYGASDDDDDF
jgi:DNA polymerase-3 subunit gamma/tau